MKRIRNVYRRMATLLCVALVGMSGAMGQVTEDMYMALPYGKGGVDVSTTNTDFETGHSQINVVYDGSKGDNDWCRFELGDHGTATIEFKFPKAITINGMQVRWGGGEYSRAQKVEIYTSDTDENPARTLTNANYTQRDYTWTFESLESVTYLRLVLTPRDNKTTRIMGESLSPFMRSISWGCSLPSNTSPRSGSMSVEKEIPSTIPSMTIPNIMGLWITL